MEAHSEQRHDLATGEVVSEPVEQPSPAKEDRHPLVKALKILWLPLLFLLTKAKTVLLILSKVKFLGTALSMLVAVGAYTLFFGLPFAAAFVLLIFVHEMGHVIQLKREGVPASAPFFIPFLGAVVAMKRMPDDAAAEARVGLAGPILGSVGTLIPLAIWLATGEVFWQALTYVGFFLNLFNLAPILPLDGGRAMAAVSPWAWVLGLVMIGAMMILYFSPILILIVVIGLFEGVGRLMAHRRARRGDEGAEHEKVRAYYKVSPRQRAAILAVYLALVVLLGFGVGETYIENLDAEAS